MAQIIYKQGLPPDLKASFENGEIAHVILIARKLVDGMPEEHVVFCLTDRHVVHGAAPSKAEWSELLGERDLGDDPRWSEIPDDVLEAANVNTALTTSYGYCPSDHGKRCFLSGTSGGGHTCLLVSGTPPANPC